jgi:glyoxylase-like metal-dependent hydrolase (beta-lactamase superfamily II)
MSKAFASQGDLQEKKISFTKIAEEAYAFTAEGDPNTGVIVGDDSVMVIDAQATPEMAQSVIERIRSVTDKPISHVVLTHYHAVRVLGASAYGAPAIIASEDTRDLIVERGEQDFKSEAERFPRLFRGIGSIPGLTWPTITFRGELRVWLGKREVRIMQPGRGHTKGDTIVWLPNERALFAGDLVEYGATPYTGDAYLTHWPATLDRLLTLDPAALVPGRGAALTDAATCRKAIEQTRAFVTQLLESVKQGAAKGHELRDIYANTCESLRRDFGTFAIFDHCMPFDVSRAFDEVRGIVDPRIWTAERDADMWKNLEGRAGS